MKLRIEELRGHIPTRIPPLLVLYKTDKNDCHICVGRHKNKWGYPTITLNGKHCLVHRVLYELYHGSIPDGHIVMHTCDNPGCINPAHLKSGTHADNQADKAQKGRGANGKKNGRAKLTHLQVHQIRYNKRATHKELAEKYGVDRTTVSKIRRGILWGHQNDLSPKVCPQFVPIEGW